MICWKCLRSREVERKKNQGDWRARSTWTQWSRRCMLDLVLARNERPFHLQEGMLEVPKDIIGPVSGGMFNTRELEEGVVKVKEAAKVVSAAPERSSHTVYQVQAPLTVKVCIVYMYGCTTFLKSTMHLA